MESELSQFTHLEYKSHRTECLVNICVYYMIVTCDCWCSVLPIMNKIDVWCNHHMPWWAHAYLPRRTFPNYLITWHAQGNILFATKCMYTHRVSRTCQDEVTPFTTFARWLQFWFFNHWFSFCLNKIMTHSSLLPLWRLEPKLDDPTDIFSFCTQQPEEPAKHTKL